MKDKLTVPFLKHQLRQATWLPMSLSSAVILLVVAYVLQCQHRDRIENIHQSLSELVTRHETFFSQEVYLNQSEALLRRIESILEIWGKKYPDVKACLRLEHPNGRQNLIEKCSETENGASSAASPKYLSDIRIKGGEQTLATLRFAVLRHISVLDLFPPVLIITILIGLAGAALAHRSLVSRVETRLLNPLLAKMRADQKNAAVAEATQMIAHDVRKPFQMLRFALQTLITSKNGSVRKIGIQISGDIDSSIRSVDAMLNDIIDIGRDLRPVLEPFSPSELARAAVASVVKPFPKSKVTFTYDFKHVQMARGDREHILRVLSNLVENAFHATGSAGNVQIGLEDGNGPKAGFIVFSVRNHGTPIPSDIQDRLFDPYFTTKKTGTGLGLAIAKKIVTAHGGEITCQSNSEQSTIFTFTIPTAGSLRDNLVGSCSTETSLRGLRERHVLIFDDESAVHAIWQSYAAEHGYQTFHHFENWEDFIAQDAHGLAKGAVAFVDLRFENSRYNGLDIARYLRKLGVQKILAMTSDQATALSSGLFDGVFGKELPENIDTLVG